MCNYVNLNDCVTLLISSYCIGIYCTTVITHANY